VTYHDGTLTLWDLTTETEISAPIAQYHLDGVRELAFSPDQTALYIMRAGEVQVWGVYSEPPSP